MHGRRKLDWKGIGGGLALGSAAAGVVLVALPVWPAVIGIALSLVLTCACCSVMVRDAGRAGGIW